LAVLLEFFFFLSRSAFSVLSPACLYSLLTSPASPLLLWPPIWPHPSFRRLIGFFCSPPPCSTPLDASTLPPLRTQRILFSFSPAKGFSLRFPSNWEDLPLFLRIQGGLSSRLARCSPQSSPLSPQIYRGFFPSLFRSLPFSYFSSLFP